MSLLYDIINILIFLFFFVILCWIIDGFLLDRIIRWFYDENPRAIAKMKSKNLNYNSIQFYKEWEKKKRCC